MWADGILIGGGGCSVEKPSVCQWFQTWWGRFIDVVIISFCLRSGFCLQVREMKAASFMEVKGFLEKCICVTPWAVPSFQEFSGSDELISGRDGWVAELRQGGL